MKTFAAVIFGLLTQVTFGACSIKNATNVSFTVAHGNVTNRAFDKNSIQSFPEGEIKGEGSKGEKFKATCVRSESLEVVQEGSAYIVKKR